jgi:hypothetical protein
MLTGWRPYSLLLIKGTKSANQYKPYFEIFQSGGVEEVGIQKR